MTQSRKKIIKFTVKILLWLSMEAAIFVSLWFGTSLRTGSLQVRARANI